MLLVGGVEMGCPLRRREFGRIGGHDREARFQKREAMNIEGPGDELRGALASFLDIGISGLVRASDNAAHSRIVIGVGRVRREGFGDAKNAVERAADPQTEAASRLVAWVTRDMVKPSADDFAMLRLCLLALSGITLQISSAIVPTRQHPQKAV